MKKFLSQSQGADAKVEDRFMNPVVETFICSEKGTSDQHYGTPTAVLVYEPNTHAGIGVLHLRGYPLLEMIEQGKKYKITVEEVE